VGEFPNLFLTHGCK